MGPGSLLLRLSRCDAFRRQGREVRDLLRRGVAPRRQQAQDERAGCARTYCRPLSPRVRRHVRERRKEGRKVFRAVVPLRQVGSHRHRDEGRAADGRRRRARRKPLSGRDGEPFRVERRQDVRPGARYLGARDADVLPRNAFRLPVLRTADVSGRHARPAERPFGYVARRPHHQARDRNLRPQHARRRAVSVQLPDARAPGGRELHALLPADVRRLRDEPLRPRVAEGASSGPSQVDGGNGVLRELRRPS